VSPHSMTKKTGAPIGNRPRHPGSWTLGVGCPRAAGHRQLGMNGHGAEGRSGAARAPSLPSRTLICFAVQPRSPVCNDQRLAETAGAATTFNCIAVAARTKLRRVAA
jgi:hypothetical protein